MQYDDSYPNSGRITFSSIVLLVIFVSAFALILAAVIWRPWFGDDGATVQAPVAQEPAADGVGDGTAAEAPAEGEQAPAEAVAGP